MEMERQHNDSLADGCMCRGPALWCTVNSVCLVSVRLHATRAWTASV